MKLKIAIAGLCIVTGLILFFHSRSDTPVDRVGSPSPKKQTATGFDSPPNTTNTALDDAASMSATTRHDQPPASLSVEMDHHPTRTEPTEIKLPALPTGDYDLVLNAEQIGTIIEQRYGLFFQSLDLPAERIARLRELLAERQQITIDAANSAVQNGMDTTRDLPAMRQAIEQAQAGVDAILRNELGDSILTACRNWDNTASERNALSDLSLLCVATEPLQPEQTSRIMQILKAHPGRSSPEDLGQIIFGGMNTRAQFSRQAITAIGQILSPRQLEMLRRHQSELESKH